MSNMLAARFDSEAKRGQSYWGKGELRAGPLQIVGLRGGHPYVAVDAGKNGTERSIFGNGQELAMVPIPAYRAPAVGQV
jgi:hypothetical protein